MVSETLDSDSGLDYLCVSDLIQAEPGPWFLGRYSKLLRYQCYTRVLESRPSLLLPKHGGICCLV